MIPYRFELMSTFTAVILLVSWYTSLAAVLHSLFWLFWWTRSLGWGPFYLYCTYRKALIGWWEVHETWYDLHLRLLFDWRHGTPYRWISTIYFILTWILDRPSVSCWREQVMCCIILLLIVIPPFGFAHQGKPPSRSRLSKLGKNLEQEWSSANIHITKSNMQDEKIHENNTNRNQNWERNSAGTLQSLLSCIQCRG